MSFKGIYFRIKKKLENTKEYCSDLSKKILYKFKGV